MAHRTYETERDESNWRPYRSSDAGMGKQIMVTVFQIVLSGAISGGIAWAGISAKQQVMEANIKAVSDRAVEDRSQFTNALFRMTEELRALTKQLQDLAIQQARMEVERERRQNR